MYDKNILTEFPTLPEVLPQTDEGFSNFFHKHNKTSGLFMATGSLTPPTLFMKTYPPTQIEHCSNLENCTEKSSNPNFAHGGVK